MTSICTLSPDHSLSTPSIEKVTINFNPLSANTTMGLAFRVVMGLVLKGLKLVLCDTFMDALQVEPQYDEQINIWSFEP